MLSKALLVSLSAVEKAVAAETQRRSKFCDRFWRRKICRNQSLAINLPLYSLFLIRQCSLDKKVSGKGKWSRGLGLVSEVNRRGTEREELGGRGNARTERVNGG